MRVLVIGGTLFTGKHLVAALQKEGHEVAVLHRGMENDLGRKVLNLRADRNDGAQVKAALAGHKFDVVFDNAYDSDRGTTAAHVEATVRALPGRVSRYIFMSSVAAYGDGLNHHEGDALAPDDHPDRYIRNKAMSERLLFRMHHRYGIPVVTLRPPYIYGPWNPLYREAFFWDRLRDKRPIILPGDGRRLMQFVFVKDLVSAMLKVMTEPNAVGHAFNIANSRPLTQAEVLDALSAAAGKETMVVRIPRDRIHRAGGHPMGPQLYFGMYFDMPPITTVISKAQRVLKFKPTAFPEGLKETYRWYVRHHARPGQDYTFENSLLQYAQAAAS
ncbi:MAG: SDR family oxidoreductase [Bryobacterales bacterium]|nr:SDR family oxidoreductase [Bryobacterales bacterium]